jgi:fructokinase
MNVAFGVVRLGISTTLITALGRLTRLGTSASLAAAITVGRHGANPPTRAELNASLELVQTSRKNSDD